MEQVSLLTGSVERWDEIKEAIDLDLAMNPAAGGELIPGTTLYALTLLSEPALTLYYTFDEISRLMTLVEVQPF